MTMSDWSSPFELSALDLRHLVQNLLNNLGDEEPRFTNNILGREFVFHFLIKVNFNNNCFDWVSNILRVA